MLWGLELLGHSLLCSGIVLSNIGLGFFALDVDVVVCCFRVLGVVMGYVSGELISFEV